MAESKFFNLYFRNFDSDWKVEEFVPENNNHVDFSDYLCNDTEMFNCIWTKANLN